MVVNELKVFLPHLVYHFGDGGAAGEGGGLYADDVDEPVVAFVFLVDDGEVSRRVTGGLVLCFVVGHVGVEVPLLDVG